MIPVYTPVDDIRIPVEKLAYSNAQDLEYEDDQISGTDMSDTLHGERGAVITGDPIILRVDQPLAWDGRKEKRYNQLVDKFALFEASQDEEIELHRLQDLRRKEKNPTPPKEMLQILKQKKLAKNVIKSLSEYVRFIEA